MNLFLASTAAAEKDQKLTPTTTWFHISSPKSAFISRSICCMAASIRVSVPFKTSSKVLADLIVSFSTVIISSIRMLSSEVVVKLQNHYIKSSI